MYFIKGSEPTDTQDVFDEKMNSTKKIKNNYLKYEYP